MVERVTPAGPGRFLSWGELACWDRRRLPWRLVAEYPAAWRADRAVTLAAAFHAIRARVAAPIVVLSAYRTPAYNRAIGGAARSQHTEGRALDLCPPAGWSVPALEALVRELAAGPGSPIGGIGVYRSFLHVDVRPRPASGRVATWRG